MVAGRMQVKKSLIRRIREGKAGKIEKWGADEKTISIFTAEEVFDLAVKGNVLIRGWGATLLLAARCRTSPACACARRWSVRVKRLMERLRDRRRGRSRATRSRWTTPRAPQRMGEHFNVDLGRRDALRHDAQHRARLDCGVRGRGGEAREERRNSRRPPSRASSSRTSRCRRRRSRALKADSAHVRHRHRGRGRKGRVEAARHRRGRPREGAGARGAAEDSGRGGVDDELAP